MVGVHHVVIYVIPKSKPERLPKSIYVMIRFIYPHVVNDEDHQPFGLSLRLRR